MDLLYQKEFDIHGITTEKANKEGVPLIEVLNKFNIAVSKSDFIIAHNISFDEKIIGLNC